MQVGDIMHTDVKTADAEDTFADVAKLMRTNGISSVVVLDGKKLAGIVTERDIVNLVAAGGDPHEREGRARHDAARPRDGRAEDRHRRGGRAHGDAATSATCRWSTAARSSGIISIRDLTRWAAEELAGGHEMPDIARSHKALQAASELQKQRRKGA